MRRSILSVLSFVVVLACSVPLAVSQAPAKEAAPKPPADVIIFANGDQLTGKLERIEGGQVVFASDMAGELKVAVDKVKELRSGAQFALLVKGQKVGKDYNKGKVKAPEGTIAVADGKLTVTSPAEGPASPAAAVVPVQTVDYLIDTKTFDRQIGRKAGFRDGWGGTATGGATLVRSTTSATTFTAALNLIRSLPTVAWLAPRNRTTINVQESYGKNTSPGAIPQTTPPTPSVTTLSSIFHADAERDEYFSPRFYLLADTDFDHNYAQGLQLQQIYGGGIGWTPIKNPRQQLDLKIDAHYEKQEFITQPVNGTVVTSTPNMNIIGSTIFENYRRSLPRKLVFTQTANVLPAFNDSSAYSANATAALAIPVVKRLSASISTTDNYLNDPQVGYKKNSYQFVTGVTYLLR